MVKCFLLAYLFSKLINAQMHVRYILRNAVEDRRSTRHSINETSHLFYGKTMKRGVLRLREPGLEVTNGEIEGLDGRHEGVLCEISLLFRRRPTVENIVEELRSNISLQTEMSL